MFSNEANSPWSWGLFSFYWESEPRFTLEDGRNAWRFIVDQLRPCLTGAEEGEGEEPGVVARRQPVKPESCAIPPDAPAAGEAPGKVGAATADEPPA